MNSILLIDDRPEVIDDLRTRLTTRLHGQGVEIITWVPSAADVDPRRTFDEKTADTPTLVVTDYDLTSKGRTGLFGSIIVEWCKQRAIPVGDYSRGNPGALPKYPDLFELRVPTDSEDVEYIAGLFYGFKMIADALATDESLLEERSPAAVLARLLGAPDSEPQLSLYAIRIGQASGALMSKLSDAGPEQPASIEEKRRVLGYIVGHLLVNAVLRFPGPIPAEAAVGAFLGTSDPGNPEVRLVFENARYSGPFCELGMFYWLFRVNEIVEEIVPYGESAESDAELRRMGVERAVGHTIARHPCPRCEGRNGGFFCPFTNRIVCDRTDCSAVSNSWIPQGALLCRIEREFFDEWAPILGF